MAPKIIPRHMEKFEEDKIKNAFSISFSGDLILLKHQINACYDLGTAKYCFEDIFQYTKEVLCKTDLSIGVMEGPFAGNQVPYSNADYGDGNKLYLNYPDSYATAIKAAGFDVLSTANNHILDYGKEGAIRTIQVLEKNNLHNVGFHKTVQDRYNSMIIEKSGIKFAILSYMDGQNYLSDDYFINGDGKENQRILVHKKHRDFNKVYKIVQEDFEWAKKQKPDIVIVLPHMGTIGSHTKDDMQECWNRIFCELGADIVFTTSSHAVQPIEWATGIKGHNTYIVNSVGNFVNSRIDEDDDVGAIVHVYIDKTTKKLFASSVTPIYARTNERRVFQAIPFNRLINDEHIRSIISEYEWRHIEKAHRMVTSVMVNSTLDMSEIEPTYYLLPPTTISDTMQIQKMQYIRNTKCHELNSAGGGKAVKQALLYLRKYNNILIIGDSITEGTKNCGYGWFEPMKSYFGEDCVINTLAHGGITAKQMSDIILREETIKYDLIIIALGCNDIRYRQKNTCCWDGDEYKKYIEKMSHSFDDEADVITIAPWISDDVDLLCKCDLATKYALYAEFSEKLKNLCDEKGWIFLNLNEGIHERWTLEGNKKYMNDYIHPNMKSGIVLYCTKFLEELYKTF